MVPAHRDAISLYNKQRVNVVITYKTGGLERKYTQTTATPLWTDIVLCSSDMATATISHSGKQHLEALSTSLTAELVAVPVSDAGGGSLCTMLTSTQPTDLSHEKGWYFPMEII